MKDITLEELEDRFDEVLDDVSINKTTYKIFFGDNNEKAAILMPYDEYNKIENPSI